MPTTKQFIEEFGRTSYAEHPFCDGDATTFAQIIYMPFEWVSPDKFGGETIKFGEAAEKIFDLRGRKHKPLGLMINSESSKRIMEMSVLPRFSDIEIACVRSVYSSDPAVQYGSGAFILPDGTMVIVYRGTDDTLAGWKEDLDIYTRKGTPSYGLALEFLNEAAAAYPGDIIICGHSKGGHLALRTACRCSEEIRARIKNVYNFDGPGYADFSIFASDAYKELLPGYKHYIPYSSFIGIMLDHDYDYKAILSSKHIGALQHDLCSWQIKDGDLVVVDDTDFASKLMDQWLALVMGNATDSEVSALDAVVTAITLGAGQKSLTDFVRHIGHAVSGSVKAYEKLPEETKVNFKDVFRGSGRLLVSAARFVRTGADVVTDIIADKIVSATA